MNAVAEKWGLTREGFDKFLACLDPDRDKAGQRYQLIREKLVNYFDWRDCPFPEDHADDALNRVVRKVAAGEEFQDIATYVFGVARMILLEVSRNREKERVALLRQPTVDLVVDNQADELQARVDCLRKCLASLPDKDRTLILQYYEGEGSSKIRSRKALAERLNTPPNALRIKACRLRDKLGECLNRCLLGKRS